MKQSNESFWPSYVDVMTALFAVMLVLFGVNYVRFKQKEAELQLQLEKWNEVKNIYKTVADIDKKYFAFNEDYQKFICKIQIKYKAGCFNMNQLLWDDATGFSDEGSKTRYEVLQAGHNIKDIIDKLQKRKEESKSDIKMKYLIVIEGQASADGWIGDSWQNNNTLSYNRALKLHEYWKENGVDFTQIKDCELVICGSGEGGKPRAPRISEHDDSDNQRFLIQIVPVLGDVQLDENSIVKVKSGINKIDL